MKLTPNDRLADGTKVSVQGCKGYVVGCKTMKDQFGMPIELHTVKLTERYVRSQCGRPIYKPINETKDVNYSFITVLQS